MQSCSRRSYPGAGRGAEVISVLEIHVHCTQAHDRARNLGGEAERNAFFRLDVQNELVGHEVLNFGVAEQNKRRAAELNHDLRGLNRKMLSGAQVEGNVRPAPVVDGELHGDEGFGAGIGGNVGLVAISGHVMRVFDAGPVLAADGAVKNFLGRDGLDGVQNFGLLVADGVGLEGNRRLHGGEGDRAA